MLLTASFGNMTLSYAGSELLAELLCAGQWRTWARAVAAIVRRRRWRLRGALLASFAPFLPLPLWQLLSRAYFGLGGVEQYSAIRPARFVELDRRSRAGTAGWDLSDRPWRDGVAMRLLGLSWTDAIANQNKGALGGWGIDVRDPTADRRLVEFCLSTPTEQFFHDGTPHALVRAALADRAPREVLNEARRGLQAADWHEGADCRTLAADRRDRSPGTDPAATRALDLARLRRLAETWPADGWDEAETIMQYRSALLRGVSIGHFMRRASGSNA